MSLNNSEIGGEAGSPVIDQVDTPAADTATARRSPLRLPETLSRYLVRGLALLAALLVWHWASSSGFNLFINFENVPGPLVVGQALTEALSNSDFYLHILHSLRRITVAYAVAVVLGVGLGILMGRSRLAEDIITPYIELLRPIPAVAWIPLAILMMPSEESSIIFITFLGALFPIVINTVHGVEQTPKVLVRAARSLGASNAAILRHVVLPGALPSIVAGLAIGMGVAWFSLLAGEIISGQYGIGYFTWSAYTLILYPQIIIGMLMIGGLGTLCTLLIKWLCRPLLRWQVQEKDR
ncbi:ABC transporter permease [Alloalcanivorax xenomutans]|uniref:ABC transporter permease n=1 Tax=Alloalcanivorax xenomutans TaxID=1094342 RepID=UPI003D9AC53E